MNKNINRFILLFPFWAILLSLIALYSPEIFVNMKLLIIPLLTVIMLGMGLTLKLSDFKRIFLNPKAVFIGVAGQYLIMPLSAFAISKILNFSPELTAGMILVGSSAGGTASNVMTYIAEGDVALSISMTMFSTLLAVLLTPLICFLYLNQTIEVPAIDMLSKIFQIVIVPVLIGAGVNSFFGSKLEKVKPFFPLISTLSIIWIIAIIIALNKQSIENLGALIFIGVLLHNSSGLAAGYFLAKLFKLDEKACRTVAIEIGMQNSGLSVALAIKFFSAAAAVPGALFSIWHNISGSFLAVFWRKKS